MSMQKQINLRWLSSFILIAVVSLIMRQEIYAQANRNSGGDIVCPATGSSIEVVPARSSRFSIVINNTSGVDIRMGLIPSGTGALSNANALLVKAGQPYSDSSPGGSSQRIVCASTTAATATISYLETYR